MRTLSFNVFFIFIATIAFGQDVQRNRLNIDVNPSDLIVVELEGEIVLENLHQDKAEIIFDYIKTGKIYGLSNADNIPVYDLEVERQGNTIYVKPKKRKGLIMVGISTQRERFIHHLYLPEFAKVSVRSKKADIKVRGKFTVVEIDNDKGDTELVLDAEEYKYLDLSTREGKILKNASLTGEDTIKLFGNGESVIAVKSRKGNIFLQLK